MMRACRTLGSRSVSQIRLMAAREAQEQTGLFIRLRSQRESWMVIFMVVLISLFP